MIGEHLKYTPNILWRQEKPDLPADDRNGIICFMRKNPSFKHFPVSAKCYLLILNSRRLFGEQLTKLLDELNEALVA
jgi:hypothetical protein